MIFKENTLLSCVTFALLIIATPMALAIDYTIDEHGNKTSRISDESALILDESIVPSRPFRLEFGTPFLGTGIIEPGYELPGGAVLQPSLLIFGSLRTAVQTFRNPLGPGPDVARSEWASRLDIFANLQLTGTERILLGLQPLHDRDSNTYTGINFGPNNDVTGRGDDGYVDKFNADIRTLYFEGDLGEMFPNLDRNDFLGLDIGISVGRQPLFFQEGLLINDTIDSIGLIRNNLVMPGGSNLQITGIYGWNGINRADNIEQDEQLHLFGLFTQMDLPSSTVSIDLVYTLDDENDNDGLHWGVSSSQRIGHFNTNFHLLGSHSLGPKISPRRGIVAAVDDGYLLWAETSFVMPWSEDNVYFNAFWGIDSFSSAARGPDVGGPLGRHGLLFASQGLGRYTPAISNQSQEAYGFALGYQMFFDGSRRQVLFELGSTDGTESNRPHVVAILTRIQQAVGQRFVIQLDGFYSYTDDNGVFGNRSVGHDGYGLRSEIRMAF